MIVRATRKPSVSNRTLALRLKRTAARMCPGRLAVVPHAELHFLGLSRDLYLEPYIAAGWIARRHRATGTGIESFVQTIAFDLTFASLGLLAGPVSVRIFLSWTLALEVEGRWPWRKERSPMSAEFGSSMTEGNPHRRKQTA